MEVLGEYYVIILLVICYVIILLVSWLLFVLGRKMANKAYPEDNAFAAYLGMLVAGDRKFSNSIFNICQYISWHLSKEEKEIIYKIKNRRV